MMRPVFVVAIGFLLIPGPVFSQGTQADYDRMKGLNARFSGKIFRDRVTPVWLESGAHFWYRVQTGKRTHEYVFVDLEKGDRSLAFDHDKLAAELNKQAGKEFDAESLPLGPLRFSNDNKTMHFDLGDRHWAWDRVSHQLMTKDSAGAERQTFKISLPKSTNGGSSKNISFVNDTDSPVQSLWVDTRGRRIPFAKIMPGEKMVQQTYVGHAWIFNDPDGKTVGLHVANDAIDEFRIGGNVSWQFFQNRKWDQLQRVSSRSASRDGRKRATIRDGNLVVKQGDRETVFETSKKGNYFRNRFFWSPNSRFLMAVETEPGEQRVIHIVESSPRDQLQPKLIKHRYTKPGDKIDTDIPRLFDLENGEEIEIDRSMLKNPWSIKDFRWRENSSEVSFLYNRRGHQQLRIIGVHPESGKTRVIVDETVDTFVDYTRKQFSWYLEDSDEIIWMSERDGWNHLYLMDWSQGEVKTQITRGLWVVRSVERVDREKRQIWFAASGMKAGEDPYLIQHYRIDFDGRNLTALTAGNGTHDVTYSPDERYLIDRFQRVDQAPVTTVRRVEDGSLVCELETADISQLKGSGWRAPIPVVAKGRDDKTDIHGIVHLPTNFRKERTYPVIEYIYAGPHDSFVPKSFSVHSQTREMAELGFIVVQIDGMGTSNRSKAFHDVCWKNLGDSGFPDRIRWLQTAAQQIPQMDLSRVGIYGGSAGGQSALRALLAHPDKYHAAVADCGCHDNRMDKIWWNEQWMGWPIGDHYAEQSNVTQAHKLAGDLLLIVGELDRNVDPASTFQVVNALIKANKDFEFLLVPGAGHGIGSGPYAMRRTRDFFVRKLYGAEPRRTGE